MMYEHAIQIGIAVVKEDIQYDDLCDLLRDHLLTAHGPDITIADDLDHIVRGGRKLPAGRRRQLTGFYLDRRLRSDFDEIDTVLNDRKYALVEHLLQTGLIFLLPYFEEESERNALIHHLLTDHSPDAKFNPKNAYDREVTRQAPIIVDRDYIISSFDRQWDLFLTCKALEVSPQGLFQFLDSAKTTDRDVTLQLMNLDLRKRFGLRFHWEEDEAQQNRSAFRRNG
jgi:hypothetical protein